MRLVVDPLCAFIDGLDEEVVEHLVRVRHAGLSNALGRIVHDVRRGAAAKLLRGRLDPAGEARRPFGGVRHLLQR